MTQNQQNQYEDLEAVEQPQEDYTSLMIGFDGVNSREELTLIEQFCERYSGSVLEIKQNRLFATAICAVPKSRARDFKMELSADLDVLRAKAEEENSNKNGKYVKWV